MKSKLMVLLSVVLAVLLSSCAAPSSNYSQYFGKVETGLWESAPITFTQDGQTYENEIIQVSADNVGVTLKLKNAGKVSRRAEYNDEGFLMDPYDEASSLELYTNYENDKFVSMEIWGGFFLRGVNGVVEIKKVSSEPQKWKENYVPVADLNDFEFEKSKEGLILTKYNGNDAYLIIPSSIDGEPITTIASGAFEGEYDYMVSAPYEIVLPNTLTTIEDNAFSSVGIRTMIIPDSVITLGKAFNNCSNLKELTIGSSVTVWPENYVLDLASFEISENNRNIKSENGLILSKDGAKLISCIPGCASKDVTIPSTVKEINNGFFKAMENYNFDSITFDNIKTLEISENINMFNTTFKFINSDVTFNGNVSIDGVELTEKSSVEATFRANFLSIFDSTITVGSGPMSVDGNVIIKDSVIKGYLDCYYIDNAEYSIDIQNSSLDRLDIESRFTNLLSLDFSGSTIGQVVWIFYSPIAEITMPENITDSLDITIGEGTELNELYIPYYSLYETASDSNKWHFTINDGITVTYDDTRYSGQPYITN